MTLIGLDFFEDCAEYFLVLSELSNVNWTLNSAATTSQLFGKGDGINVFAEEAFVAGLYFNILMTWMQDTVSVQGVESLHCGLIADLFRQIGGHSSRFGLFCSFRRLFTIKMIKGVKVFPFSF